MEIWKPIPGFDDVYEVSDQGRVRSYASRNGRGPRKVEPRLLSLTGRDKDGYVKLTLRRAGVDVFVRVHQLVLLAFVGPPSMGQDQALHGNGIRTDNRLENLRWGNAEENAQDRTMHYLERHMNDALGHLSEDIIML